MNNNYEDESLKKIGELKAILKGYHARRQVGTINKDNYDNAVEKFTDDYGCEYDFFANYGVEILNGEHCDMQFVIEKFVESNCKTWDEYCIYLLEKLIGMIKLTENEL